MECMYHGDSWSHREGGCGREERRTIGVLARAGGSVRESRERRNTQPRIDLGTRASTKRGYAFENAGPKVRAAKNKVASAEELEPTSDALHSINRLAGHARARDRSVEKLGRRGEHNGRRIREPRPKPHWCSPEPVD